MADITWSDAQVIEASLIDPGEFREVFRRHHDSVYGFVARRVGRRYAPDLTADVFMRAFKLRGRYDLTRPMCRPWLLGIAAHVIGDHLRRRRIELRWYLAPERPDDPFPSADDRVTAAAVLNQLNKALARLRRTDREVFLMYSLAELSYGEIAHALGIPIGTVRSTLARARRLMRELLRELPQTSLDSLDEP